MCRVLFSRGTPELALRFFPGKKNYCSRSEQGFAGVSYFLKESRFPGVPGNRNRKIHDCYQPLGRSKAHLASREVPLELQSLL